jgi:hypothetical protein
MKNGLNISGKVIMLTHLELLKLVQFGFAILARNGNAETDLSLMQSQWAK